MPILYAAANSNIVLLVHNYRTFWYFEIWHFITSYLYPLKRHIKQWYAPPYTRMLTYFSLYGIIYSHYHGQWFLPFMYTSLAFCFTSPIQDLISWQLLSSGGYFHCTPAQSWYLRHIMVQTSGPEVLVLRSISPVLHWVDGYGIKWDISENNMDNVVLEKKLNPLYLCFVYLLKQNDHLISGC